MLLCYNFVIFYFQKIDDASSLLTATCDTFIRTLEDIMRLTSNAGGNGIPYEISLPHLSKSNCVAKPQSTKTPRGSLSRTLSQENR